MTIVTEEDIKSAISPIRTIVLAVIGIINRLEVIWKAALEESCRKESQ